MELAEGLDAPIPCRRDCGREWHGQPEEGEWNVHFAPGENGDRPVGMVCPDCQSHKENAEGVVNEVMLTMSVDNDGRFHRRPKLD